MTGLVLKQTLEEGRGHSCPLTHALTFMITLSFLCSVWVKLVNVLSNEMIELDEVTQALFSAVFSKEGSWSRVACRISAWGHVVITFSSAQGDQVTRPVIRTISADCLLWLLMVRVRNRPAVFTWLTNRLGWVCCGEVGNDRLGGLDDPLESCLRENVTLLCVKTSLWEETKRLVFPFYTEQQSRCETWGVVQACVAERSGSHVCCSHGGQRGTAHRPWPGLHRGGVRLRVQGQRQDGDHPSGRVLRAGEKDQRGLVASEEGGGHKGVLCSSTVRQGGSPGTHAPPETHAEGQAHCSGYLPGI